MQSARILAGARRRAGLTQRECAARAGLPPSTVARIESGAVDPRVGTMERLLRVCGETLGSERVRGIGVDRTQIRELLRLQPADRLALAVAATNNTRALVDAMKLPPRPE